MNTPLTTNRRDFLRATAAVGLATLANPLSTFAAAEPAFQLGCYTRPWDQYDYKAALDGIAEAGYKYTGMSVKDFKLPKEVLVTPGTGLVNFKQVFARLKKGGFTHGPLIIECLERGDLAHVTSEAKKARQFLEGLIRQKA